MIFEQRTKGRDETSSDDTQGKHDPGEEVPEAEAGIEQQWKASVAEAEEVRTAGSLSSQGDRQDKPTSFI